MKKKQIIFYTREDDVLMEVLQDFYAYLCRELDLTGVKVYVGSNSQKRIYGEAGAKHVYLNRFHCDSLHVTLATLAHEMVHIKQFETGRLKIQDGNFIWCGKYSERWNENQALSPWEMEAKMQGDELFDSFIALAINKEKE